jgi:hypothetical protein
MTDTSHRGSKISDATIEQFARTRAIAVVGSAAAAVAGGAAAVAVAFGGGVAMASLVALVTFLGMAIGYLLGRRDGGAVKSASRLMLRVADELVEYRAFTSLLRDQGVRIIESTSGAAAVIIAGLMEMGDALNRMRMLVDRVTTDDATELRTLVEAVDVPVLGLLGQLQFQDITQQQIAFLSRLSLMLDDHMAELSRQLGERRGSDRVDKFKDLFDQALGDCVMDSQRDDHHTASGLDMREAAGSKLEMF